MIVKSKNPQSYFALSWIWFLLQAKLNVDMFSYETKMASDK